MRPARALLPLLLAACQAADPRSGGPAPLPLAQPTLSEQVRELARSSQPGSMHRRLDALVGDWTVELCDVEEDQRERVLVRGSARLAWVHGGRFLAWGAELDVAGTTSGFLGYDQRLQQYQMLMISSLSSGMGVATGYGDLTGQGVRLTQESFDPASGRRQRMTSVLRSLEAGHFVLDAEGLDARGQERVVRRTHYRRAAARN